MHFCRGRSRSNTLPVLICAILACALLVHGAASLWSLEPGTPVERMGRQSWSMENGLPQNTVTALLQSRDGFLWAATELGLARFDGAGFRVLDHALTANFPDAEIRCLLDTPSGLWVGTADGLVQWKNNQATRMTLSQGLPSNSIRGLAQTTDGGLWAWTEAGLARWDGKRFTAIALGAGAENGINSLAADSSGGLWVGTAAGVSEFRNGRWQTNQPSGKPRQLPGLVAAAANGDVLISSKAGIVLDHGGALTTVAGPSAMPADGVSFLSLLTDGTIAVASKSMVSLFITGNAAGKAIGQFAVSRELPGSRIESIYADREKCLWVGTNHGLARITGGRFPATIQLLPGTDPLVANTVIAFTEDREGDLWVGTESGGLHVLRDAQFHYVGAGDGLSSDATTAIIEDRNGDLWIGTRDAGLNHVLSHVLNHVLNHAPNGKTTTLTTADGLASNVILALAAAPNGDLWVGTPDGLNRIKDGRITTFTSSDGPLAGLPDDFIRSLLADPDGSLWIGTRHGLTHYVQGQFRNYSTSDGLGSDLVGALARTGPSRLGAAHAEGDLWIATLNGVSRLHAGKLKNYTSADGLSSNIITALEASSGGKLWIGTQGDGLNLWDGERFIPIQANAAVGLPKTIHAVLADGTGWLWLASGGGTTATSPDAPLTRVEAKSLLDCVQSRPCRPTVMRFTTADGLRSRETSSNSHPTALRGSDGQLWFTTARGVVAVDALHLAVSETPPPVAIERFAVDDADAQPSSDTVAKIPAGHLRFQFDYAGLSFASPQKVRYAYMLEGFDHGWTDAGARRTAYYTNIPHGKYRFRVRAGFWDRLSTATGSEDASGLSESEIVFELMPHIYQTWWFLSLAAVFAVVALLLIFRFIFRRRVLRVEREFGTVMSERNRIAREIHDTLAQGYVGISLQLEILGQLLRHGRTEAAAKHLTTTQDLVREGLDDARQSIWALRSEDSGEQSLPVRLRRMVEQAAGPRLHASLDVHGAVRALSADTEKEILRIAQEAIQNVKRHSGAATLRVRLEYDERFVVLSVADDGKGFSTATQLAEGHFGLTGMRERAALIQATIEIVSAPGHGSTVTLKVQARNRTSPPGAAGQEKPPAEELATIEREHE